jgi:protein tyrosine/serine phosphatase
MRKLLNLFYNFHWVVPGEAARSAQAYLGGLGPFLEANGLKSVINLRGRHPNFGWWKHESEVCARLGVSHFDAMMDSRRLPLRDMLAALFDAFDTAPRPFVIKCSGGQDRTSFAAALYIVHRGGWGAMARALEQFAPFPYLHFPRKNQRWLRYFLTYAQAKSAGAPLGDWVRRDYDPEAFAQWLKESGMADGFNGIWEPWKPPARK